MRADIEEQAKQALDLAELCRQREAEELRRLLAAQQLAAEAAAEAERERRAAEHWAQLLRKHQKREADELARQQELLDFAEEQRRMSFIPLPPALACELAFPANSLGTATRCDKAPPLWVVARQDWKQVAVKFGDKAYDVEYSEVDFKAPVRLPRQAIGTCYFYAAMNAMLNQTAFAREFQHYLRQRAAKNSYARKAGESDAQANKRRFGVKDLAMTLKREFEPNQQCMKVVLNRIQSDRALLEWCRDIVLASMIASAFAHAAGQFRPKNAAYDSQIAIALRNWVADDPTITQATGNLTGIYNEALASVEGGWSLEALRTIFTSSGLEVYYSGNQRHDGADVFPCLLARMPGDGMHATLCFGQHGPHILQGRAETPQDGACTGIHTFHWRGSDKSHGHAMGYVQHRDGVRVVDSNAELYKSADEARKRYLWPGDVVTNTSFSAIYMCRTPKWPLSVACTPQAPSKPPVKPVQPGGKKKKPKPVVGGDKPLVPGGGGGGKQLRPGGDGGGDKPLRPAPQAGEPVHSAAADETESEDEVEAFVQPDDVAGGAEEAEEAAEGEMAGADEADGGEGMTEEFQQSLRAQSVLAASMLLGDHGHASVGVGSLEDQQDLESALLALAISDQVGGSK